MHIKFQVNILCSSEIMRGDQPTIRPSDHPTDHSSDIVECRDSRQIQKPCHFQKSISGERLMIEKRLTTQIKEVVLLCDRYKI